MHRSLIYKFVYVKAEERNWEKVPFRNFKDVWNRICFMHDEGKCVATTSNWQDLCQSFCDIQYYNSCFAYPRLCWFTSLSILRKNVGYFLLL